MKLRLIVCCETNILDSRTNTVSCINLIEEIGSPQFPLLIPQFGVVALFEKEEGDQAVETCELRVKIGEAELLRGPLEIVFGVGRLHRSLVTLQGLVIPITGSLVASLERDGQELGKWEIPVFQADPQIEGAKLA